MKLLTPSCTIKLLLVVGLLFTVAGCLSPYPGKNTINSQLGVFDLTLFSHPDLHILDGVTSAVEPCLHGYEFRFEELGLAIGTDGHGLIRRIVTRNPKNSLFGIYPGDSFSSAKERLIQSGFVPTGTPYRFVQGWAQANLLVDETETVFGLAIEVLD